MLPAAILGVVGAAWALRSPQNRRAGAATALIGGVMALIYYVLLLLNNDNLEQLLEPVRIGFWLALAAAIGLIVQFVLPRPPIEDEKDHTGFMFLIPGVIWILAFTLFPLIYSLQLSFTNQRLGREAEFIGLDNFVDIFSDQRVQETVGTSVYLSISSVLLTLLVGMFIAWLFNHDMPGLRVFRTIMTIPLFAAPIALGFLGKVLFNEQSGPINYLLNGVGIGGKPWFIDPTWARIAVLIVDVWQWTPFVFIIVLAAMQSISDDLYEAASLDTSSNWRLFTGITFPLIAPALGTVAMLRLVETFKILDIPLALTDGGPGTATQTYSYYVYVKGLGRSFDLGYASAMSYLLVIIAIIVTSIYFWRVRERFQ
jgi:multiple sugar transport system permease protein